mgnify:CR=1 FL=1
MLRLVCLLRMKSPPTSSPATTTISPKLFYDALRQRGFDTYFGVPDSLLKDFCAFVTTTTAESPAFHTITANVGNAIGMATGYHLATRRPAVVYMQNSGFGNCVNPLLSLTHAEVYRVPMLLLIGWRGDPQGKADEPQHVAQGRLMQRCLDAVEVPYRVLEPSKELASNVSAVLADADRHFAANGTPFALLIKRDTFSSFKLPQPAAATAVSSPTTDGDDESSSSDAGPRGTSFHRQLQRMRSDGTLQTRERVIELVTEALQHRGGRDVVVGTTGMPSRELFECRAKHQSGHERDFLTGGAMGHCTSIAAGIAMAMAPTTTAEGAILMDDDRQVIALDGDGAALMHLGAWPVLAAKHRGGAAMTARPSSTASNGGEQVGAAHDGAMGHGVRPHPLYRLKHVVLNNAAHDSVGGQPTVADFCDLSHMARAAGYPVVLPTVLAITGKKNAGAAAAPNDAAAGPSTHAGDGGRGHDGHMVATEEELRETLRHFFDPSLQGPAFLEIFVRKGNRSDLGRPTTTPQQNKAAIMNFIQQPPSVPKL